MIVIITIARVQRSAAQEIVMLTLPIMAGVQPVMAINKGSRTADQAGREQIIERAKMHMEFWLSIVRVC